MCNTIDPVTLWKIMDAERTGALKTARENTMYVKRPWNWLFLAIPIVKSLFRANYFLHASAKIGRDFIVSLW